MRVCFDQCYDKIALRRSIYRSMEEISAYRENRRTFPGVDDYGSGHQRFLPQPQSAWSRTELLIENCLQAKRSDQGIQQQHVTKSNTEYQLLSCTNLPSKYFMSEESFPTVAQRIINFVLKLNSEDKRTQALLER